MTLTPDDPVERLLSGPAVSVHADDTLLRVAETLVEDGIGVVVVRGPEGAIGVVSERDLVDAMVEGLDLEAARAGDVMSVALLTVAADEPISAAASAMITGAVRHLPVLADGVLIGVVSARDVLAVYAT